MTNTDLAWLAGIIDGEGTISAYFEKPRKEGYSSYLIVYIRVSNTNNLITEKCMEITELGGIHYQKVKNKKWSDWSAWTARGDSACKVIKMILPYLITKREQAKIVLGWQKIKRSVGYHPKGMIGVTDKVRKEREAIYNKMMKLNMR